MKHLFLIFALILSTTACSATSKHTAVVIDSSLYEVLNNTFTIEQALLRTNSGSWTLEQSQKFNKNLLPAVEAGRSFNSILVNWKSGDPIPKQLHDAIVGISEALKQISVNLPDGDVKVKILSSLASAQSIILTSLDIVLTLKG